MEIFLDSVDLNEIRKWQKIGLIDGVTTNPSLAASSDLHYPDLLHEICNIVDDNVSAEVIAEDYDGMMREAMELYNINQEKIVIKVPLTEDGLHACKALAAEGIRVNVTLCFSVAQAIMAAKANATFISPFVGRVDDIGYNGVDLIADIKQCFDNYDFETKILAASIRHTMHFKEIAQIGADVITLPPKLMSQLIFHPLTDKGLEKFAADWKKANKKI